MAAELRVHRDPTDPDAFETYPLEPGTVVERAMLERCDDAFRAVPFRGDTECALGHVVADGEVIDVYEPPAGAGVLSSILIKVLVTLINALASLIINALFPPEDNGPPEDNTPTPSSVYTVSGVQNQAKTDEPIPVIYGKVNLTPPFAMQPYIYFDGNRQYYCALLALTQGHCNLHNLMFATAEDEEIRDANFDFDIFPPERHRQRFGEIARQMWHEHAIPFHENVYTSEQVSDIELRRKVFENEKDKAPPEDEDLSYEVAEFVPNSTVRLYAYDSGFDGLGNEELIEFHNTRNNNRIFEIVSRSGNYGGIVTLKLKESARDGTGARTMLATDEPAELFTTSREIEPLTPPPTGPQAIVPVDATNSSAVLDSDIGQPGDPALTPMALEATDHAATAVAIVLDGGPAAADERFEVSVWVGTAAEKTVLVDVPAGTDAASAATLFETALGAVAGLDVAAAGDRVTLADPAGVGVTAIVNEEVDATDDTPLTASVETVTPTAAGRAGGDVRAEEKRDFTLTGLRARYATSKRLQHVVIDGQSFRDAVAAYNAGKPAADRVAASVGTLHGWVHLTHLPWGRVVRVSGGDTEYRLQIRLQGHQRPRDRAWSQVNMRIMHHRVVLNRLESGGARTHGPYNAQAENMQIDRVQLDVTFPEGLCGMWEGKNSIDPWIHAVNLRFLFEEIDEDDRPTGLQFYYYPKRASPTASIARDNWTRRNGGPRDPEWNVPNAFGSTEEGKRRPQIVAVTTTELRMTFDVIIEKEFNRQFPNGYRAARRGLGHNYNGPDRPSTGRWRISGQRWANPSWIGPGQTGQGLQRRLERTVWTGLKGFSNGKDKDGKAYSDVYGETTLLAVRVRATQGLSQQASTRIRALMERTLPDAREVVKKSTAGAVANLPRVTTRNPVDAFVDIVCNRDYGGGLPPTVLDRDSIEWMWKYADGWGYTLDGAFERETVLSDALAQVLKIMGASPLAVQDKFGIMVPRDRPVDQYLYTDHHIAEGSLARTWEFLDENAIDGFEVEYRDPETFVTKTAIHQSGAERPERFELFGCTDEQVARQHSRFLFLRERKLRETIEFETELDGHIPLIGDRIAVQSSMVDYGRSDSYRISAHDGNGWAWVEGDPEVWGQARVRKRDGTSSRLRHVSEIRQARPGPNGEKWAYRLLSIPGVSTADIVGLDAPDGEEPTVITSTAGERSWIVTEIEPGEDYRIRIRAVNYDPAIYILPGMK